MEKVLSRNFHHAQPLDLAAYRAGGGYDSLQSIFGRDREEMVNELRASGLRGCGGAGFSTGLKWSFLAKDAARPIYLVINLDESEPGSCKDRQVLYRDPHTIVEGVLASAYIIGADKAFVFVRGEYKVGAAKLEKAVQEARDAGLLGDNILGSGFSLDIDVHLSAGRYICGEETALLNALEGYRANPRSKPPFPAVKGLWGQPTIVNNMETVCHVPSIMHKGAQWFQGQGQNGGSGTHLFQVSGPVKNPGVFELPMGVTARELIYDHAGGLLDGRKLIAFQPGGSSTPFMTPDQLDTPMHFDAVAKIGSRLGTGGVIIMDDTICPLKYTRNLIEFYARESCGFCTPCRDGLPYLVHLFDKFELGTATDADHQTILELCGLIGPNTHCALAPGAVMPVQSALQLFDNEFKKHIASKGCSYSPVAATVSQAAAGAGVQGGHH
ncbi:NADH-quinone oxidoreductase subunit NuoF [Pokkaliibacter sp. MBI-7]|uniref:NADH-quinone oxidoreductase subunit NuoF n=1 Tax=Pokkaliibacter sp. MBI-7 TaxID=3040600 RepID=UPI00244C2E17|nr:NADH-quinone oxidoreductase subunit NuoF [Pokkaliibacter sp. MBI-7]MDH2433332.1 NADH-quinone oxidoreductase subunit NuoF [Pokkaliibacter sp. MBI-7]